MGAAAAAAAAAAFGGFAIGRDMDCAEAKAEAKAGLMLASGAAAEAALEFMSPFEYSTARDTTAANADRANSRDQILVKRRSAGNARTFEWSRCSEHVSWQHRIWRLVIGPDRDGSFDGSGESSRHRLRLTRHYARRVLLLHHFEIELQTTWGLGTRMFGVGCGRGAGTCGRRGMRDDCGRSGGDGERWWRVPLRRSGGCRQCHGRHTIAAHPPLSARRTAV